MSQDEKGIRVLHTQSQSLINPGGVWSLCEQEIGKLMTQVDPLRQGWRRGEPSKPIPHLRVTR